VVKIKYVKKYCIMLSNVQPTSVLAASKKKGRPKKSPEKIAIETLGRKIKRRREAKRMSKSQLAQEAGHGLYRQAIDKIERGKQLPSIFQLVAIAKELDADLHQWLSIFDVVS
jgi:DNA-binding XRE family transcriptional regulator